MQNGGKNNSSGCATIGLLMPPMHSSPISGITPHTQYPQTRLFRHHFNILPQDTNYPIKEKIKVQGQTP